MHTQRAHPSLHAQTGSALIIGIIFLLIMTMLGLTAMQTTSLEERMAGNLRDRDLAGQAAEMALRAGEAEILGGGAAPSGQGVYEFLTNPAPDESASGSWTSSSVRVWTDGAQMTNISAGSNPNGTPMIPNLATAPTYWIEKRPSVRSTTSRESGVPSDVAIYEITARSTGASGTSPVILRSTVMQ